MNRAKIFIAVAFLLAFAVCVSAQIVQFPNELKGYEFFGKGKLKDLKLGVSTKEDVIRIFGDNCIQLCDYDEAWNIKFHYFDNWTKTTSEQKFVSSPEFAGKLWIIEIFPKTKISFAEISFSNLFKESLDVITEQGFKSALKDTIGLSYVFESETRICERTKFRNLLAIRYRVSDEIDKKAWILIQ